MAIRQIVWTVEADGTTVTPTAPQDGGVQGEDNATEVVFDLTAVPALTDGELTLYVECTDTAGGYDKTPPLTVTDGRVCTAVPLCWTQYGGMTTLRLVGEKEGQVVYTLTGRMRLAPRAAGKQVDTLLRTHIQQTLDMVSGVAKEAAGAAENAALSASAAQKSAGEAAEGAEKAEQVAEDTRRHAAEAAAFAASAERSAQNAVAVAAAADRLCPPLEKSGQEVVCYPMEGYPLQVQAVPPRNHMPAPYETESYAGASWTRGGLTFTVNEDRSITVYGTATQDVYYQLFYYGQLSDLTEGDTLLLSGCPAGGDGAYCLHAYVGNGTDDTGAGATFTVERWMLTDQALDIDVMIRNGTVCDGLTFRPRLTRAADTPTQVTHTADGVTQTYPLQDTPITVMAAAGENVLTTDKGAITVRGKEEPARLWGNVEAALDGILAIQQELMGGETV